MRLSSRGCRPPRRTGRGGSARGLPFARRTAVGDVLPAAAVERDAQGQLAGFDARVRVRLDRGVRAEVEVVRVLVVVVEVGLVAGAVRFPGVVTAGAVEVVPLDVGHVEGVEDLAQVPAVTDLLRVGGGEGREQAVAAAERVHLLAELGEQQGEVVLVVRRVVVAGVPGAGARPLPVDVEAVEDLDRGAGAPAPPYSGRLPLMYMSMQEETNFLRAASVAATSEKYFEYVQPPSETTIFRFGGASSASSTG